MKEFSFKFTEIETNIILNALSERPAKEVFNLLININNQLKKQMKEPDGPVSVS